MGSHKGICYSSFNVHLQPRNCNRVQLKMCKKWEIFRIYDELYHCEALARVFFFLYFCLGINRICRNGYLASIVLFTDGWTEYLTTTSQYKYGRRNSV